MIVEKRRRLPRSRRRALVLDAGLEVFSSCGYDGAAMEAIAARAGVSKPVLYDHFDSKRELYKAVLAEQVGLLRSSVLPPAEATPGSPERRFRDSALATLRFARENSRGWRLLFQEPVGDEEINRYFRDLRASATEAVAAVIAASGFKARHGLGEDTAPVLAGMLMAAVESLADHALAHPSLDLEALADLFMDLAWEGVG
jgi:AcrR family transcriptional regulator